jgi:hypoxanthine-guanine phosphoribosyltransferase
VIKNGIKDGGVVVVDSIIHLGTTIKNAAETIKNNAWGNIALGTFNIPYSLLRIGGGKNGD